MYSHKSVLVKHEWFNVSVLRMGFWSYRNAKWRHMSHKFIFPTKISTTCTRWMPPNSPYTQINEPTGPTDIWSKLHHMVGVSTAFDLEGYTPKPRNTAPRLPAVMNRVVTAKFTEPTLQHRAGNLQLFVGNRNAPDRQKNYTSMNTPTLFI